MKSNQLPPLSILLAALLVCTAPSSGSGQTPQENTAVSEVMSLDLARLNFKSEVTRFKNSLNDLDKTYEQHLTKLREELQSSGNLEGLLAVDEELKDYHSKKRDLSSQPRLAGLRAIYEREHIQRRNRIVGELKVAIEKYRSNLQEVQKTLTIADNLEGAIAAKNEEEKVVVLLNDRAAALQSLVLSGLGHTGAIADNEPPTAVNTPLGGAGNFKNTLGMEFVPVPIAGGPSDGKTLLFCIWETRVKDYEAFARKNRRGKWSQAAFQDDDSHPAVQMNWKDAAEFCKWLTGKERGDAKIGPNDTYRLPEDHEWSSAVGIGDSENADDSPSTKNRALPDVFPFGESYPPEDGAGNYLGEEAKDVPVPGNRTPIEGYDDGFQRTAPVGSFTPNQFGLFDMGGNVWEWCSNRHFGQNAKAPPCLWRGGGWQESAEKNLKSSQRVVHAPEEGADSVGFRIVLERGGS